MTIERNQRTQMQAGEMEDLVTNSQLQSTNVKLIASAAAKLGQPNARLTSAKTIVPRQPQEALPSVGSKAQNVFKFPFPAKQNARTALRPADRALHFSLRRRYTGRLLKYYRNLGRDSATDSGDNLEPGILECILSLSSPLKEQMFLRFICRENGND